MGYPEYPPICAYDGCPGCNLCKVPPIDKATKDLEGRLSRAERDLAFYKTLAEELDNKLASMQKAASSAAASTVTAIERIQEMEKVVFAAEKWVSAGSHAALVDAVKAWQKYRKAWS